MRSDYAIERSNSVFTLWFFYTRGSKPHIFFWLKSCWMICVVTDRAKKWVVAGPVTEVLLSLSQWENISVTSVPSAITNATTAAGSCLGQGNFVSSSTLYFPCSSNTLNYVGFFHPHCEIQKLYSRCVSVNHTERHSIFFPGQQEGDAEWNSYVCRLLQM